MDKRIEMVKALTKELRENMEYLSGDAGRRWTCIGNYEVMLMDILKGHCDGRQDE